MSRRSATTGSSALVHGRTAQAWPGTPTPLVAVTGAVMAAALAAVTVIAWRIIARRSTQPGDPVAALSRDRSIRQLAHGPGRRAGHPAAPLAGRRPARQPRPRRHRAAARPPPAARRGRPGPVHLLGRHPARVHGAPVGQDDRARHPVRPVRARPGRRHVSISADLWAATAELRAATGSAVWLFDPQHITAAGQRWWWNPLAGLTTVEAAHRLAGHFVLTVDDNTKRDIWGPAAQELLTSLLLAAAASRRTLRDVSRWLDDPGSPTPAELLDDAGYRAMASSLRGAQHGAAETRDGIYQTARTAAKCLHDEEIMAWVTPPRQRRLPVFDPAWFAASRDTLYLMTESRSAASPLIAALTDAAMRAGRRRAERPAGGWTRRWSWSWTRRPTSAASPTCPTCTPTSASRGMIPVTILQSYEQGVTVWGEPGMAALWGAATKKLIGAGVDSPRLARDLATLVGQHDVPVRSISFGDGRASEQISCQRRRSSKPPTSAAIERGTALLLATGIRPALIDLRPWHAGPDAAADRRGPAARRGGHPARRPGRRRHPRSSPAASPGQAPDPGGVMTADPAAQPAGSDESRREPVYASVEDWVDRALPAHVPAPARRGVPVVPRNGGGTPRRSPGSPPCGSPGRRCGSSPAPGSPTGSATTSTISSRSCSAAAARSPSAARTSTSTPAPPQPTRRPPAGGTTTPAPRTTSSRCRCPHPRPPGRTRPYVNTGFSVGGGRR